MMETTVEEMDAARPARYVTLASSDKSGALCRDVSQPMVTQSCKVLQSFHHTWLRGFRTQKIKKTSELGRSQLK